jgi:hypothetical protein
MDDESLIRTLYDDLNRLHEGIDENAKGLQRLSGLFREHIADNEGTNMLASTLETIASGLRDEMAYIRTVQERIREHGFAHEDDLNG